MVELAYTLDLSSSASNGLRVRLPPGAPDGGMVELADSEDLGSSAERRAGSSPATVTSSTGGSLA